MLHNIDNAMIPYGPIGCNIADLAEKFLLSENPVASVHIECKCCNLVG